MKCKSRIRLSFTLGVSLVILFSCNRGAAPPQTVKEEVPETKEIPQIPYTVTASFKHDTTSYTQGLLVVNGLIYESTGSPTELKQTRSLVGPLDTATGKIKTGAELDRKKYFGEGIAVIGDRIFQLTYKNQVGFIYDLKSFRSLGQFGYMSKEGWGLTSDGEYLIMSDGSNKLHYLDPSDFSVVKTLEVTNNGYAEEYLNELEFVRGKVYANVYGKNYIVRIDTASGEVDGVLDLSALVASVNQLNSRSEVVNGIAYDPKAGRFFVTGKLWPRLYEIQLAN